MEKSSRKRKMLEDRMAVHRARSDVGFLVGAQIAEFGTDHSPIVPPDIFNDGKDLISTGDTIAERREFHDKKLATLMSSNGTTYRTGRRHYVSGLLYQKIEGNFHILDPPPTGVSIDVHLLDKDGKKSGLTTVIRTRLGASNARDSRYLTTLSSLSDVITATGKGKCRIQDGGPSPLGDMHVFGITEGNNCVRKYCILNDSTVAKAVVDMVRGIKKFCGSFFRKDFADIKAHTEGCFHPAMGGSSGVSNVMVTSQDLGNECHVDCNDASRSVIIWHCRNNLGDKKPGNWYFLMPNVYLMDRNMRKMKKPLAIRIRHGTIISYDGRLLRHCTAIPAVPKGEAAQATFMAASVKTNRAVKKVSHQEWLAKEAK
jgi:hypothetical protein